MDGIFTKRGIARWVGVKVVLLAVSSHNLVAQIAPYDIQPEWTFGYNAYMDLRSGSPSYNLSYNRYQTAENSTAISDTTKTMVFYSGSDRAWKPGAATPFLDCPNAGGTSSTGGSVAFPSSDNPNVYYLVAGTDNTAGRCGTGGTGISWTRITNTAGTLTHGARTQIATDSEVNEALCAGADGNGGYWVASRAQGLQQVWVWHFTTAAAAPTKTVLNVTGASAAVNGGSANAMIKFSKCMDKIGWIDNTYLQVYNWNNSTGTLGSHILTQQIIGPYNGITYGFEFSPDGTKCFFSTLQGLDLVQVDLPGGAMTTLASSAANGSPEIGGMQLGPDDKIYVAMPGWYGSNKYIGVISGFPSSISYNATATAFPAGTTLSGFDGFAYRALVNVPWLNPKQPQIYMNASCDLSFDFKSYFRSNINVNSGTIEWSINGGSTWASGTNPLPNPFPGSNTYDVRVRFRDQSCNILWSSQRNLAVSCTLPVNMISFFGQQTSSSNQLTWITSGERECKEYVVYRSADGAHFDAIGSVACKGNAGVTTYSFNDYDDLKGKYFYHITQVDHNGKAYSSKTVSVGDFSSDVIITPVAGNSSIMISSTSDDALSVLVSDVTGRSIESSVLTPSSPQWSTRGELPKGVYLVSVYSNSEIRTSKILIE